MTELQKILHDPSAEFADPCEVLVARRLSADDKVRVLEQWRYDLVRLQAASDENLTGDADSGSKIRKIDECLRQLEDERSTA